MPLIAEIHRLLVDHCTEVVDDPERSQAQRQLYIGGTQRVLRASRLAPRTPHEIWAVGWDKPFFSGIRAGGISGVVNSARLAGVFNDPAVVESPEFLRDGKAGPLALEHLPGACSASFRLLTVQTYARTIGPISEAVNRFHDDWHAGDLAAEELQARTIAIAENIGIRDGGPIRVKGFGFTTACHLLADLGLPVFKPDVWVCRIVSSLPGVEAEIRRRWPRLGDGPVPFDFLYDNMNSNTYRWIIQPVMNALVVEMQGVAVDGFDLTPAFLRERFVDWTLVHFAISAEPAFGIKRRPVDALCDLGDLGAPAHVHALARWLEDGQTDLDEQKKLAKARVNLRKAPGPAERDQAERLLARLLTPEAQAKRDAIYERARKAWAAYEEAVRLSGWQFAPQYPA